MNSFLYLLGSCSSPVSTLITLDMKIIDLGHTNLWAAELERIHVYEFMMQLLLHDLGQPCHYEMSICHF